MSDVLTRAEAARFLGVSVRTLDRLPIGRSRIGRRVVYLRADLLAYVVQHKEAA